ncbi:hypothetical protein ON010_g9336 [Phytophthora cinnamomi]|nr:hypothetical protein ON010_g9336 [Phytophthora cinnamomi]
MTKRTTMMASAKAQKELETNGAHAGVDKESEAEDVVYCGEGCYNRMLFISCSDETCSAPDPSMCSNRAIKRRELKSVRVEYIPGPGFGLIANEKINAGEFIIEYVGEVIDDSECERRLIQYRDNGEVNFYMMELEKNIVIDAKYRSNDSRFINHCCDPNSVTQKWNVDGIQRIGIFARRNIAPNEEITIDYNFSHFGEAADCKCGSTACTGKMGLKRSKLSSFNPRVVGTAKAKKQVPVDEKPPELKRPVHLTSLALLKSSQMDESWMDYYGFKTRRLFLSHRPRRQKKVGNNEVNNGEVRTSLPSSSPASECSTTTEEDVSLTPPQAVTSNLVEKRPQRSDWYEKVIAGEHLAEMRALHSYICGGKSDWSEDLKVDLTAAEVEVNSPSPIKKRGPGRPPKKRGRPKKVGPAFVQSKRISTGAKLIHSRLGLSQARARGISELAAFANGKSKWNKRIPSSSSINPDRIHRLIDRVKGKQIYIKSDQVRRLLNFCDIEVNFTDSYHAFLLQNDLNEDACFRCGLAGELICCDGCPAAFHLNCTNLAMVPPDGIPWFCSECTNPRHLQKASETSDAGLIAANGTRSSNRAKHTDYASRHLRTHGAPQIPSLKKIFHSSVPHAKRRYKKRHKATDRSYRELEHMPLPVWNESDESGAEQHLDGRDQSGVGAAGLELRHGLAAVHLARVRVVELLFSRRRRVLAGGLGGAREALERVHHLAVEPVRRLHATHVCWGEVCHYFVSRFQARVLAVFGAIPIIDLTFYDERAARGAAHGQGAAPAVRQGVDALVMSFTQFAREIDGGEVVQVHFDPSRTDKKDRSGSNPMPVTNPLSLLSTLLLKIINHYLLVQSSAGGLVMISLQNETIQAVLFHDRTSDAACAALKVFLQRILQRFAEVFETELEELQPQLQASATPTAEEVRHLFLWLPKLSVVQRPKGSDNSDNLSCRDVLFAA